MKEKETAYLWGDIDIYLRQFVMSKLCIQGETDARRLIQLFDIVNPTLIIADDKSNYRISKEEAHSLDVLIKENDLIVKQGVLLNNDK